MAEEHDGFKVGDKAHVACAGHADPKWDGNEVTVIGFFSCAIKVVNHTAKLDWQAWPAAMLVKIHDTQTGHKHDDTDGGMLDRDTRGLSQPLRAIVPAKPKEPPPWHLIEAAQDRRTLWGAR